ncbi:MAG: glycoside hydrolase domain-containing protein [Acidobacteriota bacterium]
MKVWSRQLNRVTTSGVRFQILLGTLLCCLSMVTVFSGCRSRVAGVDGRIQGWIADPHRRVYFGSFGRDLENREIKLEAARNEYAICQLAVRSDRDAEQLSVEVSDLNGSGQTIGGRSVRVRYPEFLPVDENGQWSPDPLIPRPSVDLKANQTQPIWIDLQVPATTMPGAYTGTLKLNRQRHEVATFTLTLTVLDLTLPPVNEDHFYLNVLLDPGSVARLHKVPRWSEEHWKLLEAYIRNWAEHSQDAITVFFLEDPWEGDTGFPVASVVEWRLGGRWEDLQDPQFTFDYTQFDRFVQLCLDSGIDQNLQAWSPVNMPHLNYSVVHYRDTQSGQVRKVKVVAGTPEYEKVWSQFAASFEQHLSRKGWLDMTTVGLDEISTENLDRIVPVFQRIAPNLKLMVSGGDEKGKYNQLSSETAFHYGYIQSEVPLPDRILRRRQGKRTLMYTANSPLYPNTFLFSDPLESRMLPWLVWKYDFDGYIRWAWNFWVDGFREQPFYKWRSGDMFFVYPGQEGPVDSIRSEMLRKGAQDYECLWMIQRHLEGMGGKGFAETKRKIEGKLKEAMELATQQADPVRPYRPLPSDLSEARNLLNQILLDLTKVAAEPSRKE